MFALMRWAWDNLAKNPKANLIILGDFNEAKKVGDPNQALAVIFKSQPPMFDALTTLNRKIRTHTDGKAYDRIIVSEAVERGLAGMKLESVQIQSRTSLSRRTQPPDPHFTRTNTAWPEFHTAKRTNILSYESPFNGSCCDP